MKARQALKTLVLASTISFTVLVSPVSLWANTEYTKMTAFSDVQKSTKYTILVNNHAINLGTNPIKVDGKTYVPAKEIFESLGFESTWSSSKNMATFISPNRFFTVDSLTKSVVADGKSTSIKMKFIGGKFMVDVDDISRLSNTSCVFSEETQMISINNLATNMMTVLNNGREVALANGFMIKASEMWVSPHALETILPGFKVEIKENCVRLSNSYDGTVSTYYLGGRVEYTEPGSSVIKTKEFDSKGLFMRTGTEALLISLKSVEQCTDTKFNLSGEESHWVLRIESRTSAAAFKEKEAEKNSKLIALADEATPLGSISTCEQYQQVPGRNPSVRDAGYVINEKLAREIVDEINVYRVATGLDPVAHNHTLVFAPQDESDPNKNSGFDHMRWCRENFSGRNLEHVKGAPGMGEMLMVGSRAGVSARRLAQVWYNSESHRNIMMHSGACCVGVAPVQYPNGDLDIVVTFHIK